MTTDTFTPTPLCQPWCAEHIVDTLEMDRGFYSSPFIHHLSDELEVQCSNGTTVGLRVTRFEHPERNLDFPVGVAICSWATVADTIHYSLEDDGIPLADARRVAIAITGLVDRVERGWNVGLSLSR